MLIGFGFVRYVSGFRILLQNNKIMLRRDATIVQDHANIVQTRLKRAFLDDFSSEFGRYFYPVYRNVAIFAPELNKRMKMNLKKLLALATLFIIYGSNLSAKDYTVSSPNGKNVATVDDSLNITVSHSGKQVMAIKADQTYCLFPHWEQNVPTLGLKRSHTGNIKGARTSRIAESIQAPFYRQRKFDIEGNQLDLKLRDGFGMQVRAYDEGVAYRFYTTNKKGTIIADETADFCFPEDAKAWFAYSTNDEKPFAMAFQNYYDETHLSKAKDKYIFLPATIESGDVKVTILESDLRAYPGMFVKADGLHLRAAFAKYPKRMDYYKWRGMSYVAETEDYIAKSKGPRTYPWRVMAITEQDTEMPVNNLVYALATPNQIGSTDWIKPGKVAWDWWNDWNLKGVDFEAGINTRTYQYYIDFAAKNHIPYVVLDEGWYDSSKGDIMNPIPAIDLQGLIDYGREKGVSIALWTVFNVLDEHLTEACEKYAKMGVKGWKVDFMDRNDQTAVEMAERLAKTCAQYQLFLDYHGFYAPTGMSSLGKERDGYATLRCHLPLHPHDGRTGGLHAWCYA